MLPEDEAHHAVRVLRLRPGEEVALFDGAGVELRGRVTRADKRAVSVEIESVRREAPAEARVALLQAGLKRDRLMEDLVRRGTELGVSEFTFYRAQRSEKEPRLDAKWRRIAVETCKQSGRLWLPEFRVVSGLDDALAETWDSLLVLALDAEPAPLGQAVRGPRVAMLVGPEADFAPEELECAFARGGRPVSLGALTFRSEVAAEVGLTLVLYELGLLGPRT